MVSNALAQVGRVLDRLSSRVKNMLFIARVDSVDDTHDVQRITVSALQEQLRADRIQQYGFTSVPPAGCQAVCAAIGSNRDHVAAIATDAEPHREKNLSPGDVALYTAGGSKIRLLSGPGLMHLQSTGTLILECGASSIVLAPDGITFKSPKCDFQKA